MSVRWSIVLTQIEGSRAVALTVARCRPEVVCAYPISPQTHIIEALGVLVRTGELAPCEFINVESEFAALSVCIGASATGSRAYTATASQGLLYMMEAVYNASGLELPIVMTLANRAIGAPINIWNDHSDIMYQRDTGWISLFAANGQETVDMVIQAFKIGEHRDVMLPVNINIDGFQLTHVVEPIFMPDQEEVDRFLPPYKPYAQLHPDKPMSMGALGLPEIFNEAMRAKDEAILQSKKVVLGVWKEWEKQFGRKYEPIESYKTEGAETLLLTMGSMGETAEIAIDELRKDGLPVGLLKIKLWRPFPFEELRKAVKGAKALAVMDRAVSFGGPGGPVFAEIRSALYDEPKKPRTLNFIIGLGGRDVVVEDFIKMAKKTASTKKLKPEDAYEIYGARE